MPFENPSALTNFVELLFILLIPAALTATFGRMVGARRQGWALYGTMMILLLVGIGVSYGGEQAGSPAQDAAGISATAHGSDSAGGNLEGKEQRFGIASSTEWAAATTAASNGSVNSALDSYTGIGGTPPLVNMLTGEVIFGGVGSGLYGMLLFVLLAVFIAGLMVGRTPEYLGKKIEAREIKLVMIGTLVVPLLVLVLTAVAISTSYGSVSIFNSGPAGLLGDPLRLRLAGQQQRLGLRRLHRLRPAERTRQRRLVRDYVRRPARRRRDADRALRPAPRRAGGGRLPRRQARGPGRPRHVADRQPDLRGAADLRDRGRRGAHLLPRASARPDRPGPDGEVVLMARDLRSGAVALIVLTVVLGLGYSLVLTGISQALFGDKADGSLVKVDGRVVGSKLLGQDFSGDPSYFQSRPSATGYSGDVTYFSNLGPNSRKLARQLTARVDAYLKLEGPYTAGLTAAEIPPDAVMTSASGVDPQISSRQREDPGQPRGGRAKPAARSGPVLVDDHTDRRGLGFLGEPGVDVLELNIALDREAPR